MTTYARSVNGTAVDVTTTNPVTIFHPTIAAQFITVPDGTLNGATLSGGFWNNPMATQPVTPVAPLPTLTPMTLYMAFTPAERIAIKTSNDAMVKEFWSMYQLSVQLDKPTDPNLASVRDIIAYLAKPASPGPGGGILASPERVQQILAGIPQ
ncbi:hypothetical protein [Rugamonas rivuli]|uniref:Uncharacterized protein n=1 Tax=Rugamonas rivuli TaxID=2743358 RepID=A0A843SLV5_9BURK|nr:hypothetical protein [Rugamonas rivuli]MQA21757.1 hypothetical protein [Rugamonas rivuli]